MSKTMFKRLTAQRMQPEDAAERCAEVAFQRGREYERLRLRILLTRHFASGPLHAKEMLSDALIAAEEGGGDG